MQSLEELKSGTLKGSKTLKLSCELTEFPKEIFDLADTLELLDLSGNLLSKLPDDFGRFSKLKIAFFSDNCFTELPKVLSQCPQLEMIGFKSNQISKVHEESIPKQTRWLILTNNQIEELPKSIGDCYRLQKCALAGNKLKNLPTEMANCSNLELLRISANELMELPEWLLSLPKLSWLAFSGNAFNSNHAMHNSLPKINWNELQLKEVLGQGASGVISKALWIKANKDIAVKVFKGEVTSDGLPHDEMLACIEAGEHDNLVKVLGQIANHPEQKEGVVLELIPHDYKNLGMPPSFVTCTRDTFKEGTVFTLDQIKISSLGIASAMNQLHENGIMHGDLYAHNVLIDESAHALLGDFGAATFYEFNSFQTTSLQKLDVRAFGCLLDDMLQRVNLETQKHPDYKILVEIKNNCMSEIISNRPDFKNIVNTLKAI